MAVPVNTPYKPHGLLKFKVVEIPTHPFPEAKLKDVMATNSFSLQYLYQEL